MQSRREPDGVGLGVFSDDGTAEVHKASAAAYRDAESARKARELRAATFGRVRPVRLYLRSLARQPPPVRTIGVIDHLGGRMKLVHGDTDSERLFALINSHRVNDDEEALGLRYVS